MRTVVIGGTGHIGSYLVPRLVLAGYEVISISRQKNPPYHAPRCFDSVQQVKIDRNQADEAGNFGPQIADMAPDVVIDLMSFTPDSTTQLAEALKGRVQHFLHCGTIWVHGHNVEVPATESQPRQPIDQYGIDKTAIETYLIAEAHRNGFPATIVHPGHIVGPGWTPLNPAGHFNTDVFTKLAQGQELVLPNLGLETAHHVHADDVAQVFMLALASPSTAIGESFHAVSPAALTMRGYAEAMAQWFAKPAKLSFLPWDQWKETVSPTDANAAWGHLDHSSCCSIEKAQRLLNYQPRYSSLQAIRESVTWLIENANLTT